MEQSRAAMVGTTLLHYRITGRLGSGGMGEVYAAEDTKLQRRVALKLLPPDMAADPERLQRFQREARAVAALNHPNIVTIYSVEESDGVQFLTMELVEGKTLAEVIRPGGLPLGELLPLAVTLVDAVAYAHRHGIVHRDLKPANIMLAEDGRLKVLDFGLAKLKPALSSTESTTLLTRSLTEQHAVVGTAAYMSPEQSEGRPVDHRSDIFSLGVVLYEMACGRRPFQGDSFFSIISSILKDTPAPVSSVNRVMPASLDRIITRALAKDPADRFQDAVELAAELRVVQEQRAPARVVASLVRAVAGSRRARRAMLVISAVALLAIVAAGVLKVAPWGVRREPAPVVLRNEQWTSQPRVEQFPSLLPPDGKYIVYAGQESGNMDIYVKSTSSPDATPNNLTKDSPADDDEPAVSPDGEQIAFRSSREGGGIWVMGIGGEGAHRVTPVGETAAFNPAWSPDGKEIAYATENVQLTPLNGEHPSELRIVNAGTGRVRKIGVPDAVQPNWSPHGRRIAYWARPWPSAGAEAVSKSMDIWTVPASGGAPVALVTDESTDWNPVWSPDGRYLYFVSDRSGSMNLWRIAVDEESGKALGAPEPITTPAQFLAHPTVSADGRLIAYCTKNENTNIQKLAFDPGTMTVVGQPTPVTSGSRLWANPDPADDGEWVTFYSRDKPREGEVYVSHGDGTGLRRLPGEGAINRVPRFSPDGTWIAFFATHPGDNPDIAVWKIRFDGSGLQRICEAGSVPVWSPDGDRLATSEPAIRDRRTFILDPSRPWNEQTPEILPLPPEELRPYIAQDWSPDRSRLIGQIDFTDRVGHGIVVYTFASRTYEGLTDFGEWPAWLPDSLHVLFVSKGSEFWVLDTNTKEARNVYSAIWDVLGPPRLTRDGRSMFFSRRVTESDIWLLTLKRPEVK
jgi:Tol biopolymer transport system component